MSLSSTAQYRFLMDLISTQSYVCIYLKNGIKLLGKIVNANGEVIFLDEPIPQMVYKSQISTICSLEKK